jgi:CRP-like cAMP-binding protein
LAVLEDLSEKLYHLTDLVHDVSLRTVRGRLAKFLLAQAQGGGDVQWTHEQIAMQLGTRREVVSRALRAFLVEGLIQTDRQRILVLDPQKLENEIES